MNSFVFRRIAQEIRKLLSLIADKASRQGGELKGEQPRGRQEQKLGRPKSERGRGRVELGIALNCAHTLRMSNVSVLQVHRQAGWQALLFGPDC